VFFLTREELLEGKSVAVRAAVDPPWWVEVQLQMQHF
jgi:hypothetical protein